MRKWKPSGAKQLPVAAVFAFTAAFLYAGHALSQGYEGLIAPEHKDGGNASQEGYSGLLAPLPDSRSETPPAGYQGLIPGHTSSAREEEASNARAGAENNTEEAMTPWPGTPQYGSVATAQELEDYARQKKARLDFDNLPPQFEETLKLPNRLANLVAGPSARIEGMLPLEYTAKIQVESLMQPLQNKALSQKERSKLAERAFETLYTMVESLRSTKATPTILYQKMGLSETYMREAREGQDKALSRFEAAMKTLKEMI